MSQKTDFMNKVESLRKIIKTGGLQGIMVEKQANFSWLTGGRGFIGRASEGSCASVLITEGAVHLITNNIEAPRLRAEEIDGLTDVIEVKSNLWYKFQDREAIIKEILGSGRYATDTELHGDFRALRSILTPLEIQRYGELGRQSAEVVEEICRNLRPGVTEFQIAGEVSSSLWALGIEPITALIAFDGRLLSYRHPIPTGNKLKKYAMVVVCTRKYGLVASLTRLVSLGAADEEIRRKHKAVAAVDACFIASTRPGAGAGDIFEKAVTAYRNEGYGNEWELHHQGGLTGYSAREYIATTASKDVVALNQAFAWNPSIAGTKSEDTVIVEAEKNRILTHTGGYPYLEAEFGGEKILRPDMLVL